MKCISDLVGFSVCQACVQIKLWICVTPEFARLYSEALIWSVLQRCGKEKMPGCVCARAHCELRGKIMFSFQCVGHVLVSRHSTCSQFSACDI